MWTILGILWAFAGVAYLFAFEQPVKNWLNSLDESNPWLLLLKLFLFVAFLGPLVWVWLILAGLAEAWAWFRRKSKRDDDDTLFI